jgi:DNA adenine methylase
LAALITSQPKRLERYAEPYAGGAGAALRLLFDEYVEEIVLNDLDPGVASFWRAVLTRTDELMALVRTCPLTIAEWHRQHEIYLKRSGDDLELGFATFYLNRTNRSGILSAQPIGGLRQAGAWTMSARFNRSDLLARIKRIARYSNRITVDEQDGVEFLSRHLPDENCLFYIDPPYLTKGGDLYLDTLTWEDHATLSQLLKGYGQRWVLTYDADRRVVTDLYAGYRVVSFGIAHTAARQGVGLEYAVFAPGLSVTSCDLLGWNPQMIAPA